MIPLLLALWLGPQDKPPEKCTLSGTALDFVSGEPLAKAEITLEPIGSRNGITAVTVSGDHGRFTLVDLDPGDYHLKGVRTGYAESEYGTKSTERSGAVIHLAAGQTLSNVTLRLIPGGVISGTVRDSDGEPVEEAHVTLWRRVYANGQPRIDDADSADTDDRGIYRFRKLPAGKYFLSAKKRSSDWDKSDHSPKSAGPRYESIATFYPGVAALAMATPVEIGVGANVSSADIKLLRSPVFRVSGQVISGGSDGGAQQLALLPMPATAPDSARELELVTYVSSNEGDFVFNHVPPGSYLLQTRSGTSGALPVEVGAKDVENVRLTTGRGAAIQGRVTVESNAKLPLGSWAFVTNDGVQSGRSRIGPEQTFFVDKLKPGKYSIQILSGQMRQIYVKRVRMGGADLPMQKVDVAADSTNEVEVVLAQDGATLAGCVRGKNGEGAASATVVLIPDGAIRGRLDLYRVASTDQFGGFRTDNIAPGSYKVLAWGEVEDGQWFDQDFLSHYLSTAAAWEATPNGQSTLTLDLISTTSR